jgi:hypothetical protein
MKMAVVSEKNATNVMDGKNLNTILSISAPNLAQLKTALKEEIVLISIILMNEGQFQQTF